MPVIATIDIKPHTVLYVYAILGVLGKGYYFSPVVSGAQSIALMFVSHENFNLLLASTGVFSLRLGNAINQVN